MNAISACNSRALEALVHLVKDPTKNASNFANDAIEKILNYHVSAKYWLRNELTAQNFISESLYDMGSAGTNLDAIHNFPSLAELQQDQLNKKREIIQIDWNTDTQLQNIFFEAVDGISSKSPQKQLRQIAQVVSRSMGGRVEPNLVSDFSYKFHISEVKVKLNSNVIPIGLIKQGTFYHRALLFKAICDRLGLAPCTLVRGDFNRSWNIVDVKKQAVNPKVPLKPTEVISVSVPYPSATSKESAKRPASRGAAIKGSEKPGSKPPSPGTSSRPNESARQASLMEDDEEEDVPVYETAVIDLMFEPGKLLIVGSPQANAYQRM